MSKMPKQVKVGWRTYKVTQSEKRVPPDGDTLDGYGGMTYHEEGVIWVSKKLPPEGQRETLLHELMHCAVSALGFQHILKEAEHKRRTDNEENYVTVISSGLSMVFLDNPDVVQYLFGELLA